MSLSSSCMAHNALLVTVLQQVMQHATLLAFITRPNFTPEVLPPLQVVISLSGCWTSACLEACKHPSCVKWPLQDAVLSAVFSASSLAVQSIVASSGRHATQCYLLKLELQASCICKFYPMSLIAAITLQILQLTGTLKVDIACLRLSPWC